MARPKMSSALAYCLAFFALGAQACASSTEDDDAASGDSAQTSAPDIPMRGSLSIRDGYDSLTSAAGVGVSIECEGGAVQKTKTDARGEFAFKGPGGGLRETRKCALTITDAKSSCKSGSTPKPIEWVAVGIAVGLTLDIRTCEVRGDWQELPSSI